MDFKNISLSDLPEIAEELLKNSSSKIILFYGEMGAGKTTFIKQICKKLGVADTISSPTFSIVNEYLTSSGEIVYHFDFYRLNNESEALDIGVEEYFYSGNLCLIEWPEKINSLLPDNAIKVYLSENTKDTRNIKIV
jgi:tRNA threonylcarbamoyladenosine biosynthesis protein TsaE